MAEAASRRRVILLLNRSSPAAGAPTREGRTRGKQRPESSPLRWLHEWARVAPPAGMIRRNANVGRMAFIYENALSTSDCSRSFAMWMYFRLVLIELWRRAFLIVIADAPFSARRVAKPCRVEWSVSSDRTPA